MTEEYRALMDIVGRSRRIVFFGGAGVSTASGIPDFRSEDGLYSGKWHGLSPETILSATYFALHTADFYDYYREYMVYPDAKPNAVHRWLYDLEKADKLRGIVTQNIDGLHKAAGCKRVYELHGSVHENYCIDCDAAYPLDKIMGSDGVPRCDRCGGIIKPWVVLYGEAPDRYTGIGACREISGADTMIVAGTSLSVEPAASYIDYFTGKNLIVINKEPTPADSKATLLIRGDICSLIEQGEDRTQPCGRE
ncbi:MAG: NAD-dependent protein deacylase [Clostridiales bacterium]|nr:NAD-dependent protein deacylase [Clostridiales bacterium]